MLAATLDTSCALNFLALDEEEPDSDLLRLLHLALKHGVLVGVTREAHDEVGQRGDNAQIRGRLDRLSVFGRLEVPRDMSSAVETLANTLLAELFPHQQPESRTADHNFRDCRQLAAHKVVGRDVFVTLDRALLRRASDIESHGINVCDPAGALDLASESRAAASTGTGVAVRQANLDEDEAAIRDVLSPLATDYPDFAGWLNSALPRSRIAVAESDGRIGAVAVSRPKDDRVWKLAAFMVAPEYRRSGLGGHLLWSEMRAWAEQKVAKVYVTVSSRRGDLLPFFAEFGFVVEGVSARRYSEDHAELVVAKHFVYGDIEPSDLDRFADQVASRVLLTPAATSPTALAVHAGGSLRWSGSASDLTLEQLSDEGEVLRDWSLLEVERMFFPVVLAVPDRPVLLVPIEERWASSLIEFPGEQLRLGGEAPRQRLLLRPDNAYYCYPTSYAAASPGTPILFYVTNPTQSIVGQARIVESVIAPPEDLFVRFGDLGIYEPPDIRAHVRRGGPHDGEAMALRFAQYQPFRRPLPRAEMLEALERDLSGPQGLTRITFKDYEAIRRKAAHG